MALARQGAVLLILLLAANSAPSCSARRAPGGRVAVGREDFDERLRDRAFRKWSHFKAALGPDARLDPELGGEVRLMSGLSIAFVIIVNVLIWALVAFVVKNLPGSLRFTGWVVFGILCVYGAGVNAYCHYAYADPGLRAITNFLFGMVPLAASAASYVLALLVLDLVKATTVDGFDQDMASRLNPWEESFGGRLIFFIAVWPGLALSIQLGNTVSTGFEAAATHFDVLSLCLFIDVGRFFGHLSYLLAREWSIGKSPRSISSRPGLCYVFQVLCLVWYFALARLEAGQRSVILADLTKIHTLASLTSYVFFPLSIYLVVANLKEFFDTFETLPEAFQALALTASVSLIAIFMLLVAVVFDTVEPNLMGIGALLWVVFYGAWKLSCGYLLAFVLALLPLSALAYGAAVCSSHHGGLVREALFALLAPAA